MVAEICAKKLDNHTFTENAMHYETKE